MLLLFLLRITIGHALNESMCLHFLGVDSGEIKFQFGSAEDQETHWHTAGAYEREVVVKSEIEIQEGADGDRPRFAPSGVLGLREAART
jgi:hypothetical protein